MTLCRRWTVAVGVTVWLAILSWPASLNGNGGQLRLNDVPVGPYRMAVFTDPTPLRPDSIDVSVLVIDPQTAGIVWDLDVVVRATNGTLQVEQAATRQAADDPERYYSAKFSLPSAGDWTFTITVSSDDFEATGTFNARARERGPLDDPVVLTVLLLLPLLGLTVWMVRGTRRVTDESVGPAAVAVIGLGAFLSVSACVPPDPSPPYAELSRVFAVEDERNAELPTDLVEGLTAQHASVRAASVRALGRHERSDWIGTVARGFLDPDPEVRVVAADATAQSAHQEGAAEALAVFNTALGGERHPRVRAAIALAAGRLGRDSTLADLAERIILEVSTEPGEAALFDARSLGNPGAPLLDLMRSAGALARSSRGTHPATDDLTILLAELTAFGREQVASRTLDPTGPELTATRIRRTALTTLLLTGRLSEPVVREASLDSDPGVRAALAGALGSANLPLQNELMGTFRNDPAAEVRIRWIRAYSAGSLPSGCGPLVAATEDSDPHVRLAAIDALGVSCPTADRPEAVARLQGVAGADSEAERWHDMAHATVALARLDANAAAPFAQSLSSHPSPFARAWAARAWAVLGNVAALRELGNDPDANVRTAVAGPLVDLGVTDALPWIAEQLGSTDPQLVMTAANLLEGQPTDPAVVDALWSALSHFTAGGRETDRDPRVAVLERLEALASPADSARLRPYLEDYDAVVASRAAATLERWTGSTATPAPRPFGPQPPPPAEELARLDGAHVDLEMESGGIIRIALFPLNAPTTTARFASLVTAGTLDGLTFHRVVPGFVIQGGSPGANEYTGHGAYSRDEVSDLAHWRGTVGISTRGRDTGDGQIFVNLLDNLRLDHDYTIIGRVVAGMDVVDGVLEGDRIAQARLTSVGSGN